MSLYLDPTASPTLDPAVRAYILAALAHGLTPAEILARAVAVSGGRTETVTQMERFLHTLTAKE